MGGVTGAVPEPELLAMLERGLELVPDDDANTRALLLLDEGWIAWRFNRIADMEEPTRRGLELAQASKDPVLISGALDAKSALEWFEGHYRASVASSRERLELLERAGGQRHAVDYERSDARHMLISALTQAGAIREAWEYAAQAREADLARGVEYSAWERDLLPAFYLGEWEAVLEGARRVREAWLEAGRPPITAWAPGLSAPIAVHGYRGEERESVEWLDFLVGLLRQQNSELGPRSSSTAGSAEEAALLMRGDALLHHRRADEAADLLAPQLNQWSWSGATYPAIRAEAFVVAGRADERTIAEVEAIAFEHPLARGIARRASGIADGDEAALREALAIFREIECPHQEARTGWLLGGEERAAAERIFERLRVAPPAD